MYLAGMTKPAKTFKDLIVWQKAHQFVLAIYSLTKTFPSSESFQASRGLRQSHRVQPQTVLILQLLTPSPNVFRYCASCRDVHTIGSQ
jgi:hypothetical protein